MTRGLGNSAAPGNQIEALISVLSGQSRPFLQMFENALVSPDATLPISICITASSHESFEVVRPVTAVMAKYSMLPHFYRVLVVALREATNGINVRAVPELVAATNLFIATAMPALGPRLAELSATGSERQLSGVVTWVVEP